MENKIEIYRISDAEAELEVQFEQDSCWLTQQQMALLFEQSKQNVSLHINNCFKEGELAFSTSVKESLTVVADGRKYKTKYYNLDVVISVGYRVKSKRGTQFRQWATRRLREYLLEGYSINEKRLAEKDLEVRHLKTGISILKRVIALPEFLSDEAGASRDLLERFSEG
ncbi:virulence RhuM family protein, partial [Myxococcota bacterium]|nr:virulence RhuM family protein [Myxococcota bacterium]